jgi:hypothetical protein
MSPLLGTRRDIGIRILGRLLALRECVPKGRSTGTISREGLAEGSSVWHLMMVAWEYESFINPS